MIVRFYQFPQKYWFTNNNDNLINIVVRATFIINMQRYFISQFDPFALYPLAFLLTFCDLQICKQ